MFQGWTAGGAEVTRLNTDRDWIKSQHVLSIAKSKDPTHCDKFSKDGIENQSFLPHPHPTSHYIALQCRFRRLKRSSQRLPWLRKWLDQNKPGSWPAVICQLWRHIYQLCSQSQYKCAIILSKTEPLFFFNYYYLLIHKTCYGHSYSYSKNELPTLQAVAWRSPWSREEMVESLGLKDCQGQQIRSGRTMSYLHLSWFSSP